MPSGLAHAASARPIDIALRKLTRSANKGRVWLALAAIGVLVPGPTRRAALRGVAALAVTSSVANAVIKPLARRPRPLIDRTPVVRRLPRPPRTTSFPSGHAASAAAFTTGVTLEAPAVGAALMPVAALVGYSRVHVGVHHVSDVIAGAAIGAGIALAMQRWWPVPRAEPLGTLAYVPAPALADGAGLVVVVNPRAGTDGDGDGERIRALLPAAEIIELAPEADLAEVVGQRANTARALGVAGGDGTVAAVATTAQRHGLPLAVFPAGTLNHFARDLGVASFEDAARAVAAGTAVAVDVAVVNDTPFINSAVIGAYPDMVRRRRLLEPKIGKWLAMAVAANRVLRRHEPLRVTIDGRLIPVWTLFVGNCRYEPRGAFPAGRPQLSDGWLDLQYLRAGIPFSRTRAALSTLAAARGNTGVYRAHLRTALRVESTDGPVRVAHDGEVGEQATRFRFAKLAGRLVAYRPDPPVID